MGRKPTKEKPNALFWRKQIVLKGETLKMFNFERDYREIGDSLLGAEIIREHYRRNPPIGYFRDKK